MRRLIFVLLLASCGAGEAIDSVANQCREITTEGCRSCELKLDFRAGEAYPCGIDDWDLMDPCHPPHDTCTDVVLFQCPTGTATLDQTQRTVTFRSGGCVDTHYLGPR